MARKIVILWQFILQILCHYRLLQILCLRIVQEIIYFFTEEIEWDIKCLHGCPILVPLLDHMPLVHVFSDSDFENRMPDVSFFILLYK